MGRGRRRQVLPPSHTHIHIGRVSGGVGGGGEWTVGRGRRRQVLPPLHTHIHTGRVRGDNGRWAWAGGGKSYLPYTHTPVQDSTVN